MYEKFFSLDDLPFDGLPDPRFYFVGNCQHSALEVLTSNLSRNGAICVLSGPSGSGKTTLVRMLIRSLPKRMAIISIDDPRLDEHMLLATILRASGVVATSFESIAELTLKLRRLLEHSVQSGIVTTVILDEAQGLSDEVIEQIRLISNIEGELGKMINFLLVGQEDLISNLNKPMHKMFVGRVKAFASINALKRDEVHSYINFRMQMAGCHDPVFTTEAINTLYKGTGGLPRIINSVADRALCIAFNAQKKRISSHMVKKAIEVVRRKKSIFVIGFKAFFKSLILTLFAKIPLLLCGVAISCAVFFASYHYLPRYIDSQSLLSMVQKDELLQKNYARALSVIVPAHDKASREVKLFKASVNESLFKSDSIDTLIKIWGYQREDLDKASCIDLSRVNLECRVEQQDFDFIKMVNRPVVISMRNDDLIPFYAVLYKTSDSVSEIILNNRLWKVKTAYVKDHYDGEFTLIGVAEPSGKSRDRNKNSLDDFFDRVSKSSFVKVFYNFAKALDGENEALKIDADSDLSSKDMKKLYLLFKDLSSDYDLNYSLYDNLSGRGPYLEKN